jgi:hypothetical protein
MENDQSIQQALDGAELARSRAYVPYSHFRMGAAVVTERGEVVLGSLENSGGPDLLIAVSDGKNEPERAFLRDLATQLPFKNTPERA